MIPWDEHSDKVSKQRPDLEKARSLTKIAELRMERAAKTELPRFSTLVVEEYYEVIKEISTGIMCTEGWKTTSHELMIGYLAEFHMEITQLELVLIDQLRIMRNDMDYRGITIDSEYLGRNQDAILSVIKRLRTILDKKLDANTAKPKT